MTIEVYTLISRSVGLAHCLAPANSDIISGNGRFTCLGWLAARGQDGLVAALASWLCCHSGRGSAGTACGACCDRREKLACPGDMCGCGRHGLCGQPSPRDRWTRARRGQDEQLNALAEGCLANTDGTLKTVREFTDPLRLGVHEAATLIGPDAESTADGIPAYVIREVDGELQKRLAGAGFVLVTGPSAAGKSRTCYEAVQAVMPGHRLIAPESKKYLAAAIARFAQERRCVLWLDDLERFTGPDGLTRAAIGRMLDSRGHHRAIVATMRDGELERHAPGDTGTDTLGRELQRSVRDVIEQAWKIEIRSAFSAAELARARDSGDPRIARALAQASKYGVTQYLAAAPRLLHTWKSGWVRSPRGAALIAAAVDCRRAGLTGPLPQRLLEDLHGLYLDRQAGNRARGGTREAAWEWATTPPDGAAVPLLRRVGRLGYTVFDYLVDSAQRHVSADDLIPRQVLAAALRYADPAEAQSVGWTAEDRKSVV